MQFHSWWIFYCLLHRMLESSQTLLKLVNFSLINSWSVDHFDEFGIFNSFIK